MVKQFHTRYSRTFIDYCTEPYKPNGYMRSFAFLFAFFLALNANAQTFDTLVWSDEFNVNGSVDTNNWFHQTLLPNNGQSWFNGEVQHYTNRDTNSSVSSGKLYLTAIKETFTDQGVTKDYTSARLNSKFAFTYGRVEIRAQLPTGIGTWPALWMLGQNITETGAYWQTKGFGTTGWPACGEVDIMEHWGDNQNYISSAMHTPSSYGGTQNKGSQYITGVSTGFKTYAVEWTPTKMVFSVDSVVHYTYEPATRDANTWPFDDPQYLLFNVAIQSSITASFTQSPMIVDYIRVYQSSTLSKEELEAASVELYPNPSRGIIHVVHPFEIASIEIFDITGKLVQSEALKDIENVINISNLAPGTYQCTVTNDQNGQSVLRTFMKQ